MSQPPESQGLSGPSDADVWDEIKRETGFVTYKDYLDLFLWPDGNIRADLSDLYYSLVALPQEKYSVRARCYFIDLSETRSLSTSSLDFSDHSPHDDSTKLLTALRNPSPQACFRILLLETQYDSLPPKLVDAIGLGLGIWPQFFNNYIAKNYGLRRNMKYPRSIPMRERHGTIACTTFTVARDYLPGRSNCPPVILIMNHPVAVKENVSWPFQKPGHRIAALSKQVEWPEDFRQLFIGYMKQDEGTSFNMKAVLICALLPLLELFFDELGVHYDNAKEEYRIALDPQNSYCMRDDIDENEMERTRFKLRRLVRDSEQCVRDLKRYLRTQDIVEPTYYNAFRTVADEANLWLDDARALEAEIRDKLQLQVGSLALEESKKSIQMTNIQIEESKAV